MMQSLDLYMAFLALQMIVIGGVLIGLIICILIGEKRQRDSKEDIIMRSTLAGLIAHILIKEKEKINNEHKE